MGEIDDAANAMRRVGRGRMLLVAMLVGSSVGAAGAAGQAPDLSADPSPDLSADPSPDRSASPEVLPDSASVHELVVAISGVQSIVGELRIAVFDSPESFVDQPVVSAVIPVDVMTTEWRVRLPAGQYAVAVIHDEDGNGELNTNFLGMPRERYGFSNQARGRFGAPAFEDASFTLEAGTPACIVEVR